MKLFWDEKKVNEIGRMIEKIICEIPIFYKGVSVDEYVIMPDHIHFILIIENVGADPRIRPILINPIECVGADPRIRPISINPIECVGADPRIRPILINPIECVGADPRIRPISINPIECVGADPRIRPKKGQTQGSARTFSQKLSLSEVVQRFKALTTRRYIDGVRNNNWPKFHGRLWQRGYFERIVRDEFELARVRKYIENNPKRYLSNGPRGLASSRYFPK